MDPANRSDTTDADATAADVPSDATEAEELFTLVYEELRRLAECQLASEPKGLTLQATALVHEAYLKLSRSGRSWSDRRHFFAAAAEAMRRILVDHARRRKRLRRGGGRTRVEADLVLLPEIRPDEEVLALADALSQFEQVDERAALLVKLRYFAGLTLDEAAVVIGVSRATVTRDWSFAKAWLRKTLTEAYESPTSPESTVPPQDNPPEPPGSP